MSTKIAKFVSSALNNSSANEAAQALKMAAVYMQQEGANPADFIQEKGAQTNTGRSDSAELREAKELAIKWHRIAKEQEQELEQTLEAASLYQKGFVALKTKHDTLKGWFRTFAGITFISLIGIWAFSYQTGVDDGAKSQANMMSTYGQDSYNNGYKIGYDTGKADALKEAATKKPNPFDKFDDKASCMIFHHVDAKHINVDEFKLRGKYVYFNSWDGTKKTYKSNGDNASVFIEKLTKTYGTDAMCKTGE